MTLQKIIYAIWQNRGPIAWILWPLSLVYCSLVELRRLCYWLGVFPVYKVDQPVIVVGNLTVGGTGKTPVVIWLSNYLSQHGYKPGVVSRGYARENRADTLMVSAASEAFEVGDEPLLISRRTQAPVAVSNRRIDAIKILIQQANCDVFVCDDGLQDLAIEPDVSIALTDAQERIGNGFCLPAGPLRERASWLKLVDFVLVRGKGSDDEFSVRHEIEHAVNLRNPKLRKKLCSFAGQKVIAFAGIHNPKRFFKVLRGFNIQSTNISFPDHYRYKADDFANIETSDCVVLMTEKDAVKCDQFAADNWWYVHLEIVLDPKFIKEFDMKLAGLNKAA